MTKSRIDARVWLGRIKELRHRIENKNAEIRIRRDLAEGITVPPSGDRVQASSSHRRTANAVDCVVDMERDRDGMLAEYDAVCMEVVTVLSDIPFDQADVLTKRYVLGWSFKAIADTRGKTESWATTVHKRGLESVEKIINL